MEALALIPAVLDALGVATIHTSPTDPTYHIYQEWCDGTAAVQAELLRNQTDLTGVLYWNKDCEFQVVSMIADLVERSQRGDWCVGQHGTRLSRGSEPVRFNCGEMCDEIVVPMRQPHALALKLVYESSTVITATNCTFWPDFDAEKDF